MNDSFKDKSVSNNIKKEKNNSDTKKSDDSIHSDKTDKSSEPKSKLNRISINARKMFFLSFKSKKKTKEEEKTDVQQKDLLVSTMKKRYEKNSSKAQK